jgi:hypothetical protein
MITIEQNRRPEHGMFDTMATDESGDRESRAVVLSARWLWIAVAIMALCLVGYVIVEAGFMHTP